MHGYADKLHGFFYPAFGFIMFEGRKEMFYLMMHSAHFIYGYMVSGMW